MPRSMRSSRRSLGRNGTTIYCADSRRSRSWRRPSRSPRALPPEPVRRSPLRWACSHSKERDSQSPTRVRSVPAGRTGQAFSWLLSDSVSAASQPYCSGAHASRAGCATCAGRPFSSAAPSRSTGSSCRSPSRSSRRIDRALLSSRRTLGRPYEHVTLRTSDGLDLAAWYVPSRNGAAVISFPTRKGKLPQARMLVRHGYGVLLLDARGYDGSDGDSNVFGWGQEKDIDAAVAWLRNQSDVQDGRVGGIGFSVGGEMMLRSGSGQCGSARGRLRRRRRALDPRRSDPRTARLVGRAPGGGPNHRTRRSQRHRTAALARATRRAHRPTAALPDLCRTQRRRRGSESRLLPRRVRAEDALEDSRGEPRRRLPGATARVRTPSDRFLRRRATRTDPHSPGCRSERGLRKLGRSLLAAARRRRSLCAVERSCVRGRGGCA